MAVLTPEGINIFENGLAKNKKSQTLEWSHETVEKQGHPHFMLKEISEQPKVINDTIRGRLETEDGLAHLGGLKEVEERLRKIQKLIIVGCGSALYSGKVGEYMIEEYAGIPVECEFASEFRYRKPVLDNQTAVLAVQSIGRNSRYFGGYSRSQAKGDFGFGDGQCGRLHDRTRD